MGISDVWGFLRQYGPVWASMVCALIFYMWKDWRRETHLIEHSETLEKDFKEMWMPMLEKCTIVIAQNTTQLTKVDQTMLRCTFARQYEQQNALDQVHE
jgi:hypothetical protein